MEYDTYDRFTKLEARVSHLEAIIESLLAQQGLPVMESSSVEVPQVQAIRDAVRAGNKIRAIKLYREYYQVGLKEAKQAVDAM